MYAQSKMVGLRRVSSMELKELRKAIDNVNDWIQYSNYREVDKHGEAIMSQDKSKFREEAERLFGKDVYRQRVEGFSIGYNEMRNKAVNVLAKALEDNSYLKEAVDYWVAKRKEEIEKEDKADCEGCREKSAIVSATLKELEVAHKQVTHLEEMLQKYRELLVPIEPKPECKCLDGESRCSWHNYVEGYNDAVEVYTKIRQAVLDVVGGNNGNNKN
jgi:hypothetical protein